MPEEHDTEVMVDLGVGWLSGSSHCLNFRCAFGLLAWPVNTYEYSCKKRHVALARGAWYYVKDSADLRP
eukprot:6204505-Pleurochrysis_carterae.AAC.3